MQLKLFLGGEIRKFNRIPESFDLLLEIVSRLYGVKNIAFQYTDEENDTVTFSSEEEYQDAIFQKSSLKLFIISSSKLVQKNEKFLEDNGFEKLNLSNSFSESDSSSICLSEQDDCVVSNKDLESPQQDLTLAVKNLINYLPIDKLRSNSLSCSSCNSNITTKISLIIEDQTTLLCESCQNGKSGPINLTIDISKLKELIDNPSIRRDSFCLIRIKPESQSDKVKPEIKNKPKQTLGEELTTKYPKIMKKASDIDKEDILDKRRASKAAIPKIRSFTLNDQPKLSSQQFEDTLSHLFALGFKDRSKNISALVSCKYDISKTIILLSQ